MTLTTTQLRERIDSLDSLLAQRDVALRLGHDDAAEAARRDWEREAREACFQAGATGRALWYTGVSTASVRHHLGRIPMRYKLAFAAGGVGAILVRRAAR